MRPAVLDSSIYIAVMRRGEEGIRALQAVAAGSTIWLSSVVLQELYAGAADRDLRIVEAMEAEFERMDKVLVPNLNDWTEAGRVLARLAARHHYEKVGRARLTNDALIAMSAARLGLRVITANRRDFHRLSEFRAFELQVTAL